MRVNWPVFNSFRIFIILLIRLPVLAFILIFIYAHHDYYNGRAKRERIAYINSFNARLVSMDMRELSLKEQNTLVVCTYNLKNKMHSFFKLKETKRKIDQLHDSLAVIMEDHVITQLEYSQWVKEYKKKGFRYQLSKQLQPSASPGPIKVIQSQSVEKFGI